MSCDNNQCENFCCPNRNAARGIIAEVNLAAAGRKKIDWVAKHMPLLNKIKERFERDTPLAGCTIALSIHMEAKTAYLCEVLAAGGATVLATGSNPLSTKDDVAAALATSEYPVTVFAKHGCTEEEYNRYIEHVLADSPNIIIDDGGDLVAYINNHLDKFPNLIGGCEETTTGVLRLQKLKAEKNLHFPMVLVNDAYCKHLFDNRYGTGQSVLTSMLNLTNLSISGKNFVVAGYGWCGRGIAMRARGMGANVIVTEINPIKALEAEMDGFTVMPMMQAALKGDFFVTATGCEKVITTKHFARLKDGAILANAGHFDVEVDMAALREGSTDIEEVRPGITKYNFDETNIYVLAEGRLVNLAGGDGHPAEIMDMSFAIQALSAEWLYHSIPQTDLYSVPEHIDMIVAKMKLQADGILVDKLTPRQYAYLYPNGEDENE